MARNIEIKARIAGAARLLPKIAAVADQGPIEIRQDDTFFRCDTGKLKLRAFSKDEGELIFYRRADGGGPRESFYLRSATSAPGALRQALYLAYGVAGRVRKRRTLFIAGRTRIHLERVLGLGQFLELEVVLKKGESARSGVSEARRLMALLGIAPSQLVESAYVDLLAQKRAPRRGR